MTGGGDQIAGTLLVEIVDVPLPMKCGFLVLLPLSRSSRDFDSHLAGSRRQFSQDLLSRIPSLSTCLSI